MERKPYYILRMFESSFILHEGIAREKYPHSGNTIQLYLSDEEVRKWNKDILRNTIRRYYEIIRNRCAYIPAEIYLYAISEVLYEVTDKKDKYEKEYTESEDEVQIFKEMERI